MLIQGMVAVFMEFLRAQLPYKHRAENTVSSLGLSQKLFPIMTVSYQVPMGSESQYHHILAGLHLQLSHTQWLYTVQVNGPALPMSPHIKICKI